MAPSLIIPIKQLFSLTWTNRNDEKTLRFRSQSGESAGHGGVLPATLTSPELLFCESPPFLSSSRLSPSLWIPITVAVEAGLWQGHTSVVNCSGDSWENKSAKRSKSHANRDGCIHWVAAEIQNTHFWGVVTGSGSLSGSGFCLKVKQHFFLAAYLSDITSLYCFAYWFSALNLVILPFYEHTLGFHNTIYSKTLRTGWIWSTVLTFYPTQGIILGTAPKQMQQSWLTMVLDTFMLLP